MTEKVNDLLKVTVNPSVLCHPYNTLTASRLCKKQNATSLFPLSVFHLSEKSESRQPVTNIQLALKLRGLRVLTPTQSKIHIKLLTSPKLKYQLLFYFYFL